MKAYVYETFEQLGRIPANIVIPVGNGTLFIGAVKALEHLHASGAIERFPNIIALQSEKCDPLYRAREAGLEDPARVTPAPTMAEGIAIGVPMRGREILDMMKRHDIRVVHAPEDRILEARALLARRGIYCEHQLRRLGPLLRALRPHARHAHHHVRRRHQVRPLTRTLSSCGSLHLREPQRASAPFTILPAASSRLPILLPDASDTAFKC